MGNGESSESLRVTCFFDGLERMVVRGLLAGCGRAVYCFSLARDDDRRRPPIGWTFSGLCLRREGEAMQKFSQQDSCTGTETDGFR